MQIPRDESDVADALKAATAPIRITGGGTRPIGNPVEGDALSTEGLSGITLYEPGALTIVAKAGTPVGEIEAALRAENQRLPFEPMDHRALLGTEGAPTIGGVVAANVSGPRRIQAGACRDSLIGVRFVDGVGTVLKNGGRVMKNVTGYDLVKLMAGSYGTLGVLTEVSFKVLPTTAATGTVLIDGLDVGTAVQAMSTALGSPYEVTGAAHGPLGPDGAALTMIRIEGFESSVTYRGGELQRALSHLGGDLSFETDPEVGAELWSTVRNASVFQGTDEDVWRLSVKPTDAPKVAEALDDARLLFDWGGGLIWAGVAPGTYLWSALAGIDGHATLVRAAADIRKALGAFHPEPAPVAALSEGLRRKFDPRGILNPGLMG